MQTSQFSPMLPAQPSTFIGRQREVDACRSLLRLSHIRLLTLSGPPGTGKTRLALKIAETIVDDLEDEVYFVSLAQINSPDLVASSIAQALAVKESGSQRLIESLKAYLRDKKMLILLDNFEHLLQAAPLVAELLAAGPGLKVMVTSREVLHLSGEHNFPVPPLSLPPMLVSQGSPRILAPLLPEQLATYEAVQLFVQRSTALSPDFALTAENAAWVAEICRRLDGLPLAIELAAARIRHLPLPSILDRLRSRLDLLTGGAQDLPVRQRTLRATIEWSHDLLSEQEKKLFRRLAVFRGGRTLEAIEDVCNVDHAFSMNTLDVMASLMDKSLLQQHEGAGSLNLDRIARYVMLETIHEFAWGKLEESGEDADMRRRHAAFYLDLVQRAEPALRGPQQVEWLGRLEAEHDNLRAALEWSCSTEDDVKLGLQLAGSLFKFWDLRGHLSEGRRWLGELLATSEHAGDENDKVLQFARVRALNGLGVLSYKQGYIEQTRAPFEEALAIARRIGDTIGLGRSLSNLGVIVYNHGDYSAARALQEESLELTRQTRDGWYIAASLEALGSIASEQGAYTEARLLFEESLVVAREVGGQERIADALRFLGLFALRQGEYASARPLFEESLAIWRQLGTKAGVSWALLGLGNVAYYEADDTQAEILLGESLTVARELGAKVQTAWALAGLGNVALRRGEYIRAIELFKEGLTPGRQQFTMLNNALCLDGLAGVALAQQLPEQAAALLAAAEAQLSVLGAGMWHGVRLQHDRNLAATHSQLNKKTFTKAWADGQAMSAEQAVAYAQAVNLLDVVPRHRGERRATSLQYSGLTRREREVAALIAQGESNRQIADELVIGERTVEGHVSSILSKLGFHSRAQVSVWAVEKGLTKLPE